jgi:tRNA-2-methylthio-N6-dimethylallyladenosine synthase
MNAHDSERLAGLLDEAGYQPAADGETPDVVVFNTCAVRENAADRLYGNLGHLLPQKKKGMQIAVGGCLAQMERTRITQRAPWVDVVYGTHNMGSLPALLERARVRNEAQAEFAETLETFPSLLPARRESAYSAWVAISVGCNNTCTFCIVPSLRGKEKDRRPGDILGEIRALVADGVLEVTLLGQNVNSYGAEFGDRNAFGKLLRGCGEIGGLERVRFTSPHPRDFTDDVIDAMAETPNVMPSLHMPLQSGSDRILKAMRRAYRRDRYLAILDRVRASIPDAAITTDIIVGFPGETEPDFEDTLDLVRQARFAGAFTFRYSIRPGTPAATMDAQVPADIVQERYERLTALVEETTYAENQKLAGSCVEVLVAEGEGRKDAATHRMSGRARDNRLVHFTPQDGAAARPAAASAVPRPGDVVTVTVTRGAPHYLLSDAAPLSVRRTRAGDAWAAAAAAPSADTAPATPPAAGIPVLLGMPARPPLGLPALETVQEVDEAGEVHRLVVVHGHVAAVRAVQVASPRQAAGHHLHVARVHGVVARADNQCRHVDRGQFPGPVPVRQAGVRADAQLAGSLHGHVDGRVDVGEGAHHRIRPVRHRHAQHVMDVVLLVQQLHVPGVLGISARLKRLDLGQRGLVHGRHQHLLGVGVIGRDA